jgi:hypothetical protein
MGGHVPIRGNVYKRFRWRNLRNRDHLAHLGVNGKILLKWNFKKLDGAYLEMDCVSLRLGICGRLL